MERAGANAIQIEDQDFPKRCGHLDDKTLIPAQEMVGKIKAAVDARRSRETLIIARTDAVAVEGFDRAIARAALYREAGADVLFIEAPRERAELGRIGAQMGQSIPLMANMVEGGKTPILAASELQALGFAFVIFPGGHRARARQGGGGVLPLAEGERQHRCVPAAHVRLRRAQSPDRHAGNAGAWQTIRSGAAPVSKKHQ